MDLPDEIFLDLAGNRIDMIWFQDVIEKLKLANPETKDWKITHFIEFLKSKNVFNYRAVRAIDSGAIPKKTLQFTDSRKNYSNLNPVFIVCTLDKNPDIIPFFKHIKTYPENVQ